MINPLLGRIQDHILGRLKPIIAKIQDISDQDIIIAEAPYGAVDINSINIRMDHCHLGKNATIAIGLTQCKIDHKKIAVIYPKFKVDDDILTYFNERVEFQIGKFNSIHDAIGAIQTGVRSQLEAIKLVKLVTV